MATRFVSTRGGSAAGVSFEEALLQGIASDGGLFVPAGIPVIPKALWTDAATLDALAIPVLDRWIGDEFEPGALASILREALDFPVPLVPAGGGVYGEETYVLELFHGPTLSFKDVGARTMARLMAYFLARRGRRLTILVATSGDTGSAVADGFAGLDAIDVVLLYPRGRVSPIQELQLIHKRPGVRALAIEGTFDDCQRLVKQAFLDPELASLPLSSANSINIGRLLPQMLYYLWGAAQGAWSTPPSFCVPSGNLGNLSAGVLAHLSGMPVRRFVAAHNENDFFPRYLAGEEAAFGPSVTTPSSAMDVGAPSNFERLDWLLDAERMRRLIRGERVDNAATLEAMRAVRDETGYLADPHTAVGFEAVRRQRAAGDVSPFVVLSTAHPAKFVEIVEEALGFAPDMPARLAAYRDAETDVLAMPADYPIFRQFLRDASPGS
ncbi:MAG: threonine synthase [Rhodothermales bacterium]